MSPRTEQVSIYLRYISGGVTKETFVGYSLRPSKTGTTLVHYYFFSLAGPRDKRVVFAIRAKLGLIPQMDVRAYAYGYNTRGDAGRCCTKAPYYASNERAGEGGLEVGDQVYTWVRPRWRDEIQMLCATQ